VGTGREGVKEKGWEKRREKKKKYFFSLELEKGIARGGSGRDKSNLLGVSRCLIWGISWETKRAGVMLLKPANAREGGGG